MHTSASIPQLFQTSHQIYFVLIKADGYYAVANSCFLERFGVEESQLSSIHSFETIHPDDHASCTEIVGQCMQQPGKSFLITLRKPVPSGSYAYTKWEFTSVNVEEVGHCIQCLGFDISEEIIQRQELKHAHTLINKK